MKNKLVNWCDMMNLSSENFRQTEDYFIELVSEGLAIGLNRHNYGLIPPSSGDTLSAEIDIRDKVTENVEIWLRKCNAITQGGYLIRFNPGPEGYITKNCLLENDHNNLFWNIILIINPYKRKPTGIPDVDEEPPRHPDAEPMIELYIIPENEINVDQLNSQQIIIGKIRKQGEQFMIEENYIPPCTCMASHPVLIRYYNRFALQIGDLEKASKEIIAKVKSRTPQSPLAQNIEMLCRNFISYIATVYFSFRNGGLYWEPFEIANCFSSLAHIYYTSLSFIPVAEKEELLNYFHEWDGITPGVFETILSRVLEMKYDHNDILTVMELINEFLSTQVQLWTKLSMLEYIGQHKDNIIVSEKSLDIENSRKSTWNVLT